MKFEVSEEATTLRNAAAHLLAKEVPPKVVRTGWSQSSSDVVRTAWRKLTQVGVAGTIVEEHRGGLGLDANSLAPLLESIGYSGLPIPVVETVAVAAPILPNEIVPSVLAGDVIVAAQLAEGDLVPFGQQAELILLRDSDTLRLHERDKLELHPVRAVDGSRALARLVRPAADAGTVLAADAATVTAAWRRGVLGTAALLTGLAQRLLEMTVEYVQRREQYGTPIGSFQAIQHALADALLALEFARPAVLAAAWSQAATASDVRPRTALAKVLASDAARLVARTALQCHGAMGYTTEYDLHLFAKRIWALASSWGKPQQLRNDIAVTLGI